MNNYLILGLGFLLGQITVSVIKAIKIQGKQPNLNYTDAFKLVLVNGFGSYVLGVCALFIVWFLMPEFFKNVLTIDDAHPLKDGSQLKQIVKWFRVSSLIFGIGAQTILLQFVFKVNRWADALNTKKENE